VSTVHTVADCEDHHQIVRDFGTKNRPQIVALVGEMRLGTATPAWMMQAAFMLTAAGHIPLLPLSSGLQSAMIGDDPGQFPIDPAQARRIELADWLVAMAPPALPDGLLPYDERKQVNYADKIGGRSLFLISTSNRDRCPRCSATKAHPWDGISCNHIWHGLDVAKLTVLDQGDSLRRHVEAIAGSGASPLAFKIGSETAFAGWIVEDQPHICHTDDAYREAVARGDRWRKRSRRWKRAANAAADLALAAEKRAESLEAELESFAKMAGADAGRLAALGQPSAQAPIKERMIEKLAELARCPLCFWGGHPEERDTMQHRCRHVWHRLGPRPHPSDDLRSNPADHCPACKSTLRGERLRSNGAGGMLCSNRWHNTGPCPCEPCMLRLPRCPRCDSSIKLAPDQGTTCDHRWHRVRTEHDIRSVEIEDHIEKGVTLTVDGRVIASHMASPLTVQQLRKALDVAVQQLREALDIAQADKARAEAGKARILDRLNKARSERDEAIKSTGHWRTEWEKVRKDNDSILERLDDANAAIARVRELHAELGNGCCAACHGRDEIGISHGDCDTIRALDDRRTS